MTLYYRTTVPKLPLPSSTAAMCPEILFQQLKTQAVGTRRKEPPSRVVLLAKEAIPRLPMAANKQLLLLQPRAARKLVVISTILTPSALDMLSRRNSTATSTLAMPTQMLIHTPMLTLSQVIETSPSSISSPVKPKPKHTTRAMIWSICSRCLL